MKIFYSKNKLIKITHSEKNIGFIPTMGAIHKGHVSLIKKSKAQCKKTVVSIYVNKPQFNKKSDYDKYPRLFNKDIKLLKKLKVDLLFIPKEKQIYPKGINKNIKIHNFKRNLCGKFRPNHFEAVADVISRFIKIVNPKKIFMGEKDMQQFLIIKDFVRKNYSKINVICCKTVREKSGVAYSSRNTLLSDKEKKIAVYVYKLLSKNKVKIKNKKISLNLIKKKILSLNVSKIEYLKVFNINNIINKNKKNKKLRIFIAYYLGTTRLIDNI
jgi:pantoate--beta-alanine ligase